MAKERNSRCERCTPNSAGSIIYFHFPYARRSLFRSSRIDSTLGMLGRTGDLFIYGPKDLETWLRPYSISSARICLSKFDFTPLTPKSMRLSWKIVPSRLVDSAESSHSCCGYLFVEKQKYNHIIREMTDFYHVPVKEMQKIKEGADFVAGGWRSHRQQPIDSSRRAGTALCLLFRHSFLSIHHSHHRRRRSALS